VTGQQKTDTSEIVTRQYKTDAFDQFRFIQSKQLCSLQQTSNQKEQIMKRFYESATIAAQYAKHRPKYPSDVADYMI